MPKQVSMGAKMKCTYGGSPADLMVLPKNKVFAEGPPAANILDHIPLVNILPFGMCSCSGNPVVAAATAAAMGAMAPMPCIPATLTPWSPGAETVLIAKSPALDDISTCKCSWGGEITFVDAATVKTMIP